MRIVLRLFLARFNQAIATYSLARLEAVLRNPGVPDAPVLRRMGSPAVDGQPADSWPQTRRRVEMLQRYIGSVKKGKVRIADDATRERLIDGARQVIEFKNRIEALHVSIGRRRAR